MLPGPALASRPLLLIQTRAVGHVYTRLGQLHSTGSPLPRVPKLSSGHLGPPHAVIRRYASAFQYAAADTRSLVTRSKNLFLGTAIAGALVLGYYYITDTRAGVHRWLVVPALRWIYDDAEEAHEVGTRVLKALYEFGLHPRERGNADQANDLVVEVWIFLK